MALNYSFSDAPRFVPADYKKRFSEPCEFHPGERDWYKGTGISPKKHPLAKQILFYGCANCDSNRVLVIAAQHNFHLMNGNAYWDYELYCRACKKFSLYAYAED